MSSPASIDVLLTYYRTVTPAPATASLDAFLPPDGYVNPTALIPPHGNFGPVQLSIKPSPLTRIQVFLDASLYIGGLKAQDWARMDTSHHLSSVPVAAATVPLWPTGTYIHHLETHQDKETKEPDYGNGHTMAGSSQKIEYLRKVPSRAVG